MQRDREALIDIVIAADRIAEFLEGFDFDRFAANAEKQSAVLHQIMILGEATKRLSQEFRQMHERVPWSNIAGMRDRLMHAYDDVDLTLVWESVTRVLPPIVDYLRRIAPANEP